MNRSATLWGSGRKALQLAKQRLLGHRYTRAFAHQYPRAYQFILDRFSLDAFTGLPLTFLVAAFVVNLMLLDEITESFVNSTAMVRLDDALAHFLYSRRVSGLAGAFYYFTMLGSFWGVVLTALLSTLAFYVAKKHRYILPVWISLLCTQLTIAGGKTYFHRLRPDELSYYKEDSYSFPSGHATVSVAFYGVLFYAVIRSRRRNRAKLNWTIAAIVFIGLLGFSRLYLCVHYLSDVLAGYSLGFLWMLLAISISEWNVHRKKMKHRQSRVLHGAARRS